MSYIPTEAVHFRLAREDLLEVKAYADEHCNGVVSEALRALIRSGLKNTSTEAAAQAVIEGVLETKLEEIADRVARTTSRGTKASLGTEALLASYVVGSSKILKIIDANMGALMCHWGLNYDEETSAGALYPINQYMNAPVSSVYSWAWAVGGRLQKSGASYLSATQGLKVLNCRDEEGRTDGF